MRLSCVLLKAAFGQFIKLSKLIFQRIATLYSCRSDCSSAVRSLFFIWSLSAVHNFRYWRVINSPFARLGLRGVLEWKGRECNLIPDYFTMTCVFGEQVDGDFRLIVIINWSLMVINFVMDTGGHSEQKILRSNAQGKVNCLSGFVSFWFIVHSSVFYLFLLNKVHTYPYTLPF
jgi:hypothetical protein